MAASGPSSEAVIISMVRRDARAAPICKCGRRFVLERSSVMGYWFGMEYEVGNNKRARHFFMHILP